jgi:uncharacterized iron-regulated membrane protein
METCKMMHDWWTSGSWGMGFGWVFMLLPLALLGGLVLAIVRLMTAIGAVSRAQGRRAKSSMSGSRKARSIARNMK